MKEDWEKLGLDLREGLAVMLLTLKEVRSRPHNVIYEFCVIKGKTLAPHLKSQGTSYILL